MGHFLVNKREGSLAGDKYDDYVADYAAYVATRERSGAGGDPFCILPCLLEFQGEVVGRRVLDAGYGEGCLAGVLAGHRATVTEIATSRPG